MYTREDVLLSTGRGMCEKGVRIQERTYHCLLDCECVRKECVYKRERTTVYWTVNV